MVVEEIGDSMAHLLVRLQPVDNIAVLCVEICDQVFELAQTGFLRSEEAKESVGMPDGDS